MQRVALLNWKNKNKDYDLSKIFEAFWEPWVVKWLEYQDWNITPWFAFVLVERNGINFCVLFENTENVAVSEWKIFIEISQEKILDWSENNIDWTGIWAIKVDQNYPEKNFLKLGTLSWGAFQKESKKVEASSKIDILQNFNSANQLVKLWADWKLPALDGSNLRNIQAETKNLNLNFVAWENIEAWSFVFVAKENKRKKVFLDNKNLNLQNTFPTWNTVYKINFKKHPGKIKSFQILHNWWWSWAPSFDLYKDERCTQFFLRAGWNSLKTIREWSTESTLYEFKNFSNYDENYDLAWKILYFKASGFHKNKTIPENNFFSFVWENNPFSYIEFEQEVEKGKIYKADCFDKIDKAYFLKNEAQKWQTVQVVCTWFIENLNLSLDKKDVFLNWIWKVTQVETDLKIWEKITNSIMELKNSEEKLPLNFHNLTLEAYNYSSSTTQTITIQHNLWFVKDFQVLAYNKAQKQFYGMWKNLVSGGSEIDCKISENLFNSLKIEIRRKLVPELELRFLLI